MEGLEFFGIVLVLLGVIGIRVMLKGKRPTYDPPTQGSPRENK